MKVNAHSNFWLRSSVYSGTNTRSLIPDLFIGLGAKRILLVSDSALENAGVVKKVAETFEQQKLGARAEIVGQFLGVTQDAASECVNEALKYAREVNADAILAIGGGSVIDTAKALKFGLYKGITDINDSIPSGFLYEGFPKAQSMNIPHISVATTAGTGSEVSPIAVIYNEHKKVKMNIYNVFLSSDVAILDPELTVGLPSDITAFTGADALTHAIEAIVSPAATSITDAYAYQAIRVIERYLPRAVKDGTNIKARMEMLHGSMMGITAFCSALNAIPVHNFAHAYGALFRIPHGLANAVLLPVVMESTPDLYLPKAHLIAEAFGVKIHDEDSKGILAKVVEKLRVFLSDLGLPSDFSAYGTNQSDMERILKAVMTDPAATNYPMSEELIMSVVSRVSPVRIN
ncbi:iron-containing alcohol dehydrogenase [Peribacillus simplex]|uniref:Iron-containing alcohol dehydrogenase n=2 Tax=Peribacillus TaxID=2675229 RepID=A0AA90P3Z4_9BACI|nr:MULTISPECIES: iron-containing alcohol dehydrogenase [Peribacillus]MDP1420401.1 iron-containing alcohol dehydrogenase [Peribacillus simplex]MDP1453233.1 iron-containing alcohol dehydrogenase [Peribacillus frigoritolerans]